MVKIKHFIYLCALVVHDADAADGHLSETHSAQLSPVEDEDDGDAVLIGDARQVGNEVVQAALGLHALDVGRQNQQRDLPENNY